ncbi:MAG: glycosyltransferase family 4 protein, partial [Acidobacteriota bacterium]|nr:glycosyltransferase family 4 protein [Acidobacteriota bacterium]
KELVKLIDWLKSEPQFDVISLPYALLIGLAKPLKAALGRPIICTLQGEDLFLEGLPEPYRRESLELIRANVEHVDTFIAVSDYYAAFMSRYLHIPENKINVVPLGINLEGYGMRRRQVARPFTVGYFARIAPEKGLHVLAEAYRRLREHGDCPDARLEAAGYLGAEHQGYLRGIKQQITDWGLGGEFKYHGALDRQQKIEFLQGLDVLSVPATYDEPKGIFLLEAMACGVPVVEPRRGTFTEVVTKTEGGLLVEPDDPISLADALLRLSREPALVDKLGDNGFRAVREHYTIAQSTDRALEVYGALVRGQEAGTTSVLAGSMTS